MLIMDDVLLKRSAKQEEEAKLAAKKASYAPKVSVPNTPRSVGVGAGSRIVQTPRRRLGI
jgi:pre-mRNA-splicing factor ATP-dependent RNA helicase DHX38/PRP16